MRLRERRRIEKRARIASHRFPEFAGASPERLLEIAADTSRGWYLRGEALRLLDAGKTPAFLLEQFFAADTSVELWEAALTLEHAGGPDVLQPLIHALHDANPIRRQTAVRALGWNRHSGPSVAKVLVQVLNDASQPVEVRAEACESLAYLHWRQAIPALTAASQESDVWIRFWATFGLGGMRHRITGDLDPRAAARLQELRGDAEVAPGWWSVGQEALSMLAGANREYRLEEEREKQRILNDPNATEADRRWAH